MLCCMFPVYELPTHYYQSNYKMLEYISDLRYFFSARWAFDAVATTDKRGTASNGLAALAAHHGSPLEPPRASLWFSLENIEALQI
jgi:hypothetical protein